MNLFLVGTLRVNVIHKVPVKLEREDEAEVEVLVEIGVENEKGLDGGMVVRAVVELGMNHIIIS